MYIVNNYMSSNNIASNAFLAALERGWAGKGVCLLCNGSPSGVSSELLWNLTMWTDEIIAVDCGLEWLERANITPELMVGDMDSVNPELYNRYEIMGVSSIVTSPQKDNTDLELALMCVKERFNSMAIVVNFAGGRLDHELASLGSMGKCDFPVVAVDEHCAVVFLERVGSGRVEFGSVAGFSSSCAGEASSLSGATSAASKPSYVRLSDLGLNEGDQYSVIAYDGSATMTQSGVLYPQECDELQGICGLGISNVVTSKDAFVEVIAGKVMLVLSF